MSSTATSAFIDLATHQNSSTVRAPFLQNIEKKMDFGGEEKFLISHLGDEIYNMSILVTIPQIKLTTNNSLNRIRWVKNPLHNLFKSIVFNCSSIKDNFYYFNTEILDYILAQYVPTIKCAMYNQLIGNTPELTNPTDIYPGEGIILPKSKLMLPLTFVQRGKIIIPIIGAPFSAFDIVISTANISDLIILDDFKTKMSRKCTKNELTYSEPLNITLIITFAMTDSKTHNKIMKEPMLLPFIHFKSEIFPLSDSNKYVLHVQPHRLVSIHFMLRKKDLPGKSIYKNSSPYLQVGQMYGKDVPIGVDMEANNCHVIKFKRSLLCDLVFPIDLANVVKRFLPDEKELPKYPIERVELYLNNVCRYSGSAEYFNSVSAYHHGSASFCPEFISLHFSLDELNGQGYIDATKVDSFIQVDCIKEIDRSLFELVVIYADHRSYLCTQGALVHQII